MHICERPNVAGLVDNQATAIYPQGSELKKNVSHTIRMKACVH